MREKRKFIKYPNISFPCRAMIRRLSLATLGPFSLSSWRCGQGPGAFPCCPSVYRLQHAHFCLVSFLRGPVDLGRDRLVYTNLSKKNKIK